MLTSYHLPGKRKLQYIVTAGLVVLAMANVFIDYLFTLFQASAFYISESLLFSSFWLLFLPLLPVFLKLAGRASRLSAGLYLMGLFVIVHLLLYPALVWLLSGMFYDHTYAYGQTFNYAISAYMIKAVIIYGFAVIVSGLFRNPAPAQLKEAEKPVERIIQDKLSSLLITDNHHRKLVVAVDEILYFSANPPYVNIHLLSKKYLYPATLKMLESRLDHSCFVRVHKSHIVNINKVVSIESRQNGDYDVTITDNSLVRVSRSYAKEFKEKLDTRLTAK